MINLKWSNLFHEKTAFYLYNERKSKSALRKHASLAWYRAPEAVRGDSLESAPPSHRFRTSQPVVRFASAIEVGDGSFCRPPDPPRRCRSSSSSATVPPSRWLPAGPNNRNNVGVGEGRAARRLRFR